ncbi:MAG: class II aldolase/adducin family protein [Polaromonas sp.]|nr:class II aldolase/adducin family protein [Polaromonas sp.]
MSQSTKLSDAASKFSTRKVPVFGTVAEERRYRLERLAGVCRIFGRFGFAEGLLGHITVRDPEHADLLWQITPELLYTGWENVELRVRGALLHGGKFSEFGEKATARRLDLSVRLCF